MKGAVLGTRPKGRRVWWWAPQWRVLGRCGCAVLGARVRAPRLCLGRCEGRVLPGGPRRRVPRRVRVLRLKRASMRVAQYR